jgi:hypothetical protein
MVIYIHGNGVYPPRDQLKREWDIALFGKPMGNRTSMAYLSDILHGPSTVTGVRARVTASSTVQIIDRLIVNEHRLSRLEFNPHSSIGYLTHPDVKIVVHRQIGFDSLGRFLVARDVAEEFVDPVHRVPVLIKARACQI